MASTPIPELIARLNDADESDCIEAKRSTNELGKSALETICAFANEPGAGGGHLVFGLKEDSDSHKFHTVGVHEPKKIETDVSTLCANSFNVAIRPRIWTERIEGKAIVAVRIPEAQPHEKPVFIASRGMNKGAFRRIGSTDQHCTEDDLRALLVLSDGSRYEDSVVADATLDDLDQDVIGVVTQCFATSVIWKRLEPVRCSGSFATAGCLSQRAAVSQRTTYLARWPGLRPPAR